jgi:PAS domain S-box-containing protein
LVLPGSRALSRIPLGRALVGLGAVLVTINIAAAVWDVRTAYERVERRAQRDFSNVTRLLAAQTAASLEAADLILRDTARAGSAEAAASAIPRMRDELTRVPQVAALLVLDAEGRVLARTSDNPWLEGGIGAPVFVAGHREARGDELHMSAPYLGGRDAKQWRFLLSRGLRGPGGRFAGVAAAAIEVQGFDRLYEAIDLGAGSFITLVANDGTLVTRVPEAQAVRGRQVPGGEIYAGVERAGRFEGWTISPITGDEVFVAASAVRGFPLLVASGSNREAVLAPWRDEAWLVVDRTALTSLAMVALIALAAWGLKRREQTIARSWTRYQAMIEHSSDALILSRPLAGGVFYASPALERVLGYRLEDLRGREVMDLIHPETREAAMRLRAELLRAPGKISVDETRVRHKDGAWRWIELTRKNLLEEPSVRAVVFNFRDITERKQAEAERARLEQRLRQAEKLEAVGRLAGGIAHDFNNLLGGILGYAELLAEQAPPGSPLARYAANVLTGANRASGLVEQILSYSRSQRGRRGPVDIVAVAAETLELVRGSLASGICLDAALPAEPCSWWAIRPSSTR